MNLGLWPEAVPFDPDSGAGSQALDEHLANVDFPGAALVAVGRGLQGSEWAPRTVIGLARSLVAAGRDVLLADLDFETPTLHDWLSESAVEGLADVLLFGSSLERVTVLPAGQSFEFVATGGYVPDPQALRSDPAWGRLLEELTARGRIFLGFTQYDAPGLDHLVARIPSIVLLVEPEEAAFTAAALPEQIRIEAMIGPPYAAPTAGPELDRTESTPGEEASAAVTEPPDMVDLQVGADRSDTSEPPDPRDRSGPADSRASGADEMGPAVVAGPAGASLASEHERIRLPKDEAREALIADLEARERLRRERAGAAAPVPSEPGQDPSAEPLPFAESAPAGDAGDGEGQPRRGSRVWRWLAAAAVVAAGAGSAWHFGFRGAEPLESVTAPPQIARPQAPPEPAGVPLGWSVAVEAHDRLDAANRSVQSLAAADSSVAFYVSPSLVGDDLWYRVLAGPLPDSGSAVQAMNRLVDRGLKLAAAVWDVRETPFAFLLGRFPQESTAVARTDELEASGVPAYIVGVPYSYGDPWYHVYSGAYSNAAEADRMRQILLEAGLPDTLVIRVGRAAS